MFTFPPAMIFDMDGTLVDNMAYHTRTWTEFLAEHGAPVDPRAFHDQTTGRTTFEILRMYLGADLPDQAAAEYTDEKERRYRQVYESEVRPLPGLANFLDQARAAGSLLALATSAGRENIEFILSRLGLADMFDAVVSGEEVTRGKPDPEIFLRAVERLGVSPCDCLVFEDSPKGIEAAHNAGMTVIAVLTSLDEQQARALPGVVRAIRDYSELDE